MYRGHVCAQSGGLGREHFEYQQDWHNCRVKHQYFWWYLNFASFAQKQNNVRSVCASSGVKGRGRYAPYLFL